MKIRSPCPRRSFLLALFLLGAVPDSWAGNDLYLVTYNHHVEAGETELMLMNDITAPAERTGEVGTYWSSMVELEYGLTRQWATELMLEWFADFSTGEKNFTGFRWENRYRVFRGENENLNPVLYMEYEDLDPSTRFKMEVSGREDGAGDPAGAEPDRERIMETRLILSRDFGPNNVAFNWINETDLQRGGFTEFGYALGFRRSLVDHHEEGHGSRWRPTAIGFEFFGGLGNSNAFAGPVKELQQYFSPIIMFHPTRRIMIHVAAAIGLTGVSDDLVRTGVAFEF